MTRRIILFPLIACVMLGWFLFALVALVTAHLVLAIVSAVEAAYSKTMGGHIGRSWTSANSLTASVWWLGLFGLLRFRWARRMTALHWFRYLEDGWFYGTREQADRIVAFFPNNPIIETEDWRPGHLAEKARSR